MSSNQRTASVPKPPALKVTTRVNERRPVDVHLVLPFEQRCRSRFRASLDSGDEVGVVLPRGQVLRDGDLMLVSDGRVVEIKAATEPVSTARCEDQRLLAVAAYHLGNRHIALQIGAGWLRYAHDYVLDDVVSALGLEVFIEHAPFEPETGAYRPHGDHQHHHPEQADEVDYDPGEGP